MRRDRRTTTHGCEGTVTMARNFFDELKQVIKDQTKRTPGLVGNLHGVIDDAVVAEKRESNQSWYALQASAKALPSLPEFIDAHSHQRLPVAEVFGISGISLFPESGLIRPDMATLLWTSFNSGAPSQLPVSVTAMGHSLALYVNGVLVTSGVGALTTTLDLGAGQQFLALIAFGGTAPLKVTIPEEFALSRLEPTPTKPILLGNPISEYLKAQNGSYLARIRWGNDPFASAWQVYRAEGVPISAITTATLLNGVMKVRVQDDVTDSAPAKTDFFTKKFYGGEIMTATAVTVGADTFTDIEVAIDPSAPTDPSQWAGLEYVRSSDAYVSIARVTYAGESEIEFRDTSVQQNRLYLYKVTAFGFITGTSESDYSEDGWVLVGDVTPPGSVVLDLPNISVVEGEVFVPFTTPEDEDYRGVRVYLEDDVDPTKQVLVTKEAGLPADSDTVSFRLPRSGKVWFRTYDTSDNIQPIGSGVSWVFDGNGKYRNSLFGLLTATVNEAAGTVDLSLDVQGEDDLYPGSVQFFQDDLSTPMVLNPVGNVQTAPVIGDGVLSKATYPGLGGIELPLSGVTQFWAKITDRSGRVSYEYTVADRDALPGGSVIEEDYLAFPNLTMLYDEDVESIEIAVPASPAGSGATGTPGTIVLSRANGALDPTDGGYVIYTVGSTVGGVKEAAIDPDGSRGTYVVTYIKGTTRVEMWRGTLHGLPAKPPTVDAEITLDPTLGNAADIRAKLESPSGEQIGLEFKDEDDPSLPIWDMVTGTGSSTLKTIASASYAANTEWFKRRGANTWAQKLDNIPLVGGQVKRVMLRAKGAKSGVYSTWQIVPLPFKEVPVIEGVDLVFDPATGKLSLTGTGGVFSKSAKFEFSADEAFATGTTTFHEDLLEGAKLTKELTLATTDFGKRWYGRVTPFNKAKSAGTVQGLGGIGVRDSEYVGDTPWGAIDLKATFTAGTTTQAQVDLLLTKGDLAKSYKYTVSETDYDYTRPATAGTNLVAATTTVSLGNRTLGKTVYVVVWFFDQNLGTGRVSPPITAKLLVAAGAPPSFGTILQVRDTAVTTESRVDFQVQILDPQNRGGTFKAWTNKNGLTSADDSVAAEGTYAVPSTPFTVNTGHVAALDNVRGNPSEDKFVTFEFINAHGQTTGKVKVKVTAKLVDIGDDGKLNPGVVDINKLAEGLVGIERVDVLPASGTEGQTVMYQGHVHVWFGGKWVKHIELGDLQDAITGTMIKDAILTTAKFAAGIQPVQIVTVLPADNSKGNVAFLSTDGKLYRWTGSGWTAATAAGDIAGQITSTQIGPNSISTGHIVANAITSDQLSANSVIAGKIAAAAVSTTELAANAVVADKIAANAVTADKILAGAVTASKINVTSLGAINQNLGIIVSGRLNSVNGTAYLDLNQSTSSGNFLYSDGNFYIRGDGYAYFNGALGAQSIAAINLTAINLNINKLSDLGKGLGVFTGASLIGLYNSGWWINLNANAPVGQDGYDAARNGYFIKTDNFSVSATGTVSLGAGTSITHPEFSITAGGSATFRGSLSVQHGSTSGVRFESTSGSTTQAKATFVSGSNGLVVKIASNNMWSLGGDDIANLLDHTTFYVSTATAARYLYSVNMKTPAMYVDTLQFGGEPLALGSNYWTVQAVTENPYSHGLTDYLKFSYGGTGVVWFKNDGDITANSVSVYSPEPPKTRAAMTAADWLTWGAADAKKPVWPHKDKGLPSEEHPEVARRAKAKKVSAAEELAAVDAEYKKDISKIAIGTANWADLVWGALQDSKDFADFKRRLGM